MTTQEQKKLAALMEGLEKEVHFIVIDVIASMCRLNEDEQKIVDSAMIPNETEEV